MSRVVGARVDRARLSGAELVAISGLAVTLLHSCLLGWFLPADRFIRDALQPYAGGSLSTAAEWVAPIVSLSLGGLLLIAVVSGAWRQPTMLLGVALMVGSGAALNELLKTACERLRPNELITAANSFPSGHIMNTTIVAVAVCLLVRWTQWSRATGHFVAGAGVACVGAQVAARLIRESHWLSDMPASIGLGVAWAFGAASLARRLGRRGIVLAVAAYLTLYALFYAMPSARLHVISARDHATDKSKGTGLSGRAKTTAPPGLTSGDTCLTCGRFYRTSSLRPRGGRCLCKNPIRGR